jgi:hypothetical protein
MEILRVHFRHNDIECLLALHSNTFILLTSKNYIFGFREIFGGECFVIEMFQFLKERSPIEIADFLLELGISEKDFDSTVEEFNSLIGTKQKIFTVSYCNNRMISKQPSLFSCGQSLESAIAVDSIHPLVKTQRSSLKFG